MKTLGGGKFNIQMLMGRGTEKAIEGGTTRDAIEFDEISLLYSLI